MKGFRFYAEMPQERKSKSASKAFPFFPWTVAALRERAESGFRCDLVALLLDDHGKPLWNGSDLADAICSTGRHCHMQGVSRDYLRERCTRIPESVARKLSPGFVRYLES